MGNETNYKGLCLVNEKENDKGIDDKEKKNDHQIDLTRTENESSFVRKKKKKG